MKILLTSILSLTLVVPVFGGDDGDDDNGTPRGSKWRSSLIADEDDGNFSLGSGPNQLKIQREGGGLVELFLTGVSADAMLVTNEGNTISISGRLNGESVVSSLGFDLTDGRVSFADSLGFAPGDKRSSSSCGE